MCVNCHFGCMSLPLRLYVLLACVCASTVIYGYCLSLLPDLLRASAVMGSNEKRQKTTDERYRDLLSLGRSSFVTKSGIASLLKSVQDARELPMSFDRSAQYRARKHMCNTDTPYGKLVEPVTVTRTDGTPEVIGCQNPLAFLYYPEG